MKKKRPKTKKKKKKRKRNTEDAKGDNTRKATPQAQRGDGDGRGKKGVRSPPDTFICTYAQSGIIAGTSVVPSRIAVEPGRKSAEILV